MGANTNPLLEDGFCTTGIKNDIPETLRLLGLTPENPILDGRVVNKIFNMIFENLNHQKKKGFAFWQPDSYYEATENNIDICRRNNQIYFCIQTHNETGEEPKAPETNPDFWTILYDLDKPLFDEFNKYALKNGNILNIFKVKDAVGDNDAVTKLQMTNAINAVASNDTFIKPNKGVLFQKISPISIQIPSGFKTVVNGKLIITTSAYSLSLNTDLDVGTKIAGKDYYVYASDTTAFYLSLDRTKTTDKLIGGFHYGLTPDAEGLPAAALKTEADMVTSRGIKAYSMWDLSWKPANKRPEGKVLINNLFWRDIYPADEDYAIRGYSSCFAIDGTTTAKLAGGAQTNGRKFPKIPLSKGGNGTTINYGSLTWYESNEIISEVGMRMISYDEFSNSSFGVVEQKSLGQLGYTKGTGDIKHYPELESKWGVEMAVGVQWFWTKELMNGYGSTDFAVRLGLTDTRGYIYSTSNSPVAGIVGGQEDHGSTDPVGSRALYLYSCVWSSIWNHGFVAVCDHLNLDK